MKLVRDLRSEIQRLKSIIVSSDLVCFKYCHQLVLFPDYKCVCVTQEHGKEQKGRLKSTKAMCLAEDIHKKEEQV